MNKNELLKQKEELIRQLNTINKLLADTEVPQDLKYVQCSAKSNKTFFYKYDSSTHTRKYLSNTVAPALKTKYQYDYYILLRKNITDQIKLIDKILDSYDPLISVSTYEKIPRGHKNLISPFLLPDDEYIDAWLTKKKELISNNRNSYKIDDAFLTENGEYVRSKSEMIIADKLKSRGLIYVYECPAKMIDNSFLFPDFTILDLHTRTEKYLEHCGRMDDPQYSERFVQKHEIYEKSGLVAGKNLFYTYETAEHPLKTCSIDAIINQIITY